MKIKLILAVLLLFTCLTGFSQEKKSGRTKKNSLAVSEKGLIKVSVMYPFSEGKTFDIAYYEATHMPM